MIRYTVLRTVSLGFLTPQDQYDSFIDPTAKTGYLLESDGKTIWLIDTRHGKRSESITTANAIDLWLKRGDIEEARP